MARDNSLEVDISMEDFLEHFGVKGMRWGVRREQKRLDKADKKWEKELNSPKSIFKVHNRAAELANSHDVDRINNLPKFKNRDMSNLNDPITKQYFKAHEDAFNRRYMQAAKELYGTSPSGKKKFIMDPKTGEGRIEDVTHADLSDIKVRVEFDDLHQITKYIIEGGDALGQSSFSVDDFLEHFGVKGMRWGVRRGKDSHRQSVDSKKVSNLKGRSVESLSNKQLKAINDRIGLESRYKDLHPGKVKSGRKLATEILATVGIGVSMYNLVKSPAGQALLNLGKKHATQLTLPGI